MRAMVWLLLPWVGMAQIPAPESAPLVSGVLLECDAHPSGELSIRAAENRVLQYHFDARTYVERDNRLIDTSRLVAGEKIEVLSDSVAGTAIRYARTIHVIQPVPPPRPTTLGRLRAYDPKTEPVVRTGTMTYAGVVFRLNSQRGAAYARGRRPEHPTAQGHTLPGRRPVGGRGVAQAQHARLRARRQRSVQRRGSLPGDLGLDSYAAVGTLAGAY